jgi:hypothetical protein
MLTTGIVLDGFSSFSGIIWLFPKGPIENLTHMGQERTDYEDYSLCVDGLPVSQNKLNVGIFGSNEGFVHIC